MDIYGEFYGQPIHVLLGAKWWDKPQVYGNTLFRPTAAAMKGPVKGHVGQGFTALEFGWGVFGADAWLDVRMLWQWRPVEFVQRTGHPY